MKILSVVGVRPNIIKFNAWSKAIDVLKNKHKIEHVIVHSGQHYDDAIFHNIWKEFELAKINYHLNVGSGSHSWQVGTTMIELEKVIIKEAPDWVVAIDDVNTALATGITAKKLNIKLAHIEAGLRSFDKSMPEEHNRILVDHLSDLLFAPDEQSVKILISEGIDKKHIKLTGNFMADTLLQSIPKADVLNLNEIVLKHKISKSEFFTKNYALFTLHRPSNIQNENVFNKIIYFLLNNWENKTDYIIWPIHPGVYKKLNELNLLNLLLNAKHIILLNPVEYFEMLNLIKNATFVLTDSGGLQEETSILGIPCLTMRENTERPITLIENGGTNILVGHDIVKINNESKSVIKKNALKKEIAYWDGFAANRAINHLLNYI